MDKQSFLKAGHPPTLLAAFLYFDLAFMVWVILGPLGVQIAQDLHLTHAEKGLMVATPVLCPKCGPTSPPRAWSRATPTASRSAP